MPLTNVSIHKIQLYALLMTLYFVFNCADIVKAAVTAPDLIAP